MDGPICSAFSPENPASRRVSNQGCLPMSLPEYLELVDRTGRQISRGIRVAADPRSAGNRRSTKVAIFQFCFARRL